MPLALTPIPDDAFDTSVRAPQYSSDLDSIVGNAGDDSDGFESIFSIMAGHLADGPNFLTGLDGVISDLGANGDPANIPFEQAFSDSLSETISQGQPDFDAFATHLTGDNPPASNGGGGGTSSGGGSGSKSDCHARTNQYGLTTLGSFPGVTCNWKMPFQVMRVQDGQCTLSTQIFPPAGQTSFPRVDSFTLQSGDPTVFALSHHQERATDGSIVDLFDITITPKLLPAQPKPQIAPHPDAINPQPTPVETKSHFDAVGILITSNPSKTEHVCMSVDCIA